MIHFLSTLIGWNFWWTNQNSFIVKPLFVLGGHHSPVDLSRLPICGPGFESQVHHLCFVQLKSNFVLCLSLCWGKEENKQKRGCVWHILITVVYLSVCLSLVFLSRLHFAFSSFVNVLFYFSPFQFWQNEKINWTNFFLSHILAEIVKLASGLNSSLDDAAAALDQITLVQMKHQLVITFV